MALEEVAIICFSVLSCFGILAFAYFKSIERQEQIRQNGVTQRTQMKMGTSGVNLATGMPYGQQEWWVPLAVQLIPKLLENPEIMKMITPVIQKTLPSLIQKELPKVG